MKINKRMKPFLLSGVFLIVLMLMAGCGAKPNVQPSPGTPKSSEAPAASPDKGNQSSEEAAAGDQEKPSKEELLKDMNDVPIVDFTLKDLKGKDHTLSDYKGKITVLNFWASWCPPCKAEMPELESFYKSIQGTDVDFIAVNLTDGARETEAKARKFIEDNGYTFPVLLDMGARVADQYSIRSIPTTFIIDKDGIIRYYIPGQTNQKTLEELIGNVRIVQE